MHKQVHLNRLDVYASPQIQLPTSRAATSGDTLTIADGDIRPQQIQQTKELLLVQQISQRLLT